MRDRELALPDFSARPVDVDLRHDGHARAVALRIGDAAPAYLAAALVAARRRPRLPPGFLGRRPDHRDVARLFHVAQPEFDRIKIERSRELIHEGFTRKVNLRS